MKAKTLLKALSRIWGEEEKLNNPYLHFLQLEIESQSKIER